LAKKRRQKPLPIPQRPRRRPWTREFRLQLAVVSAFAVLLVGIVAGFAYFFFQGWYEANVQRPHSEALQVGETTIDLDYFARRLKLLAASFSLQDASQAQTVISIMVSTMEGEELVLQRAPADLGVTVSPQEIELAISDGLGLTESDPEAFASAYEQELKKSGLSDEEYRQMIGASLLSVKVQRVFSLSVPDTTEQVRMRQILVGTEDDARSVLERLDAGEDFGDLARELSLDSATKDQGGERDWVARDELDLSYAVKVFDLEVGIPSQPIPGTGGYFIFEVEEKQPDREVTDDQRSTISTNYFHLWLNEQRTFLAVPETQPVLLDTNKLQWAVNKAFSS
jgi:parvulin-like peptidyl-prolyl isomerase